MNEPQIGYVIPGFGDALSLSGRLRIIFSKNLIEKMFDKTKEGDCI